MWPAAHTSEWRAALLPAVVIAAVIAALVAGLLVVGSPAEQRRRWSDSRRVEDLQAIAGAVDRYYGDEKRVPDTLRALKPHTPYLRLKDPETETPYAYRPLGPREYELGAHFALDTSSVRDPGDLRTDHGVYIDAERPFWRHGSGGQRFRLTARKRDAEGG